MRNQRQVAWANRRLIGPPLVPALFVIRSVALTVQPFLRLVGTAGHRRFHITGVLPGCAALMLLWSLCEVPVPQGIHAVPLFCLLAIMMTVMHRLSSAIRKWCGAQVSAGFVGVSVVQILLPRCSLRRALMLGECALCLLAGTIIYRWADGLLGCWLCLAGMCNSMAFLGVSPADLRAEELLDDPWLREPMGERRARRVRHRVISQGNG